MGLGEKYATIAGLTVVEEGEMGEIREFIEKYIKPPELLAVFDSMWIGENGEREELIEDEKYRTKKKLEYLGEGLEGRKELKRMMQIEEQKIDEKIAELDQTKEI